MPYFLKITLGTGMPLSVLSTIKGVSVYLVAFQATVFIKLELRKHRLPTINW